MRRVKKEDTFYVYLVRVTHKGELIYKKTLKKVMTKQGMDAMLRQLAAEYKVPLNTVAFEFEQLCGLGQLCSIVLNEIWKDCIIEWKSKNLRQCLQKKK